MRGKRGASHKQQGRNSRAGGTVSSVASRSDVRSRKSFAVSLTPSNLVFATYRHFPYTLAEALAELADNSTQSFFDHQHKLKQSRVTVDVKYLKGESGSEIIVRDDAYGMDEDDLRRALRLAEPPPNRLGRSEFGMGLKTSCCWLGDVWTVRTKQFGHPYAYFITFDVPLISSSNSRSIKVLRSAAPRNDHYTEVVIQKLHREYYTRTLGKAKQRLAQAYQRDIKNELLTLRFNGENLTPDEPSLLVENGAEVRSPFSFVIGGHKIVGWVGLLAQGKGASAAGFDIYRRGRLIVPNFKFVGAGLYPEVTTNVIHQRLTGGIDLDTVPVVHLKNGIDLRNLQGEFEEKLALAIRDMRGRAIALRYFDNQIDV